MKSKDIKINLAVEYLQEKKQDLLTEIKNAKGNDELIEFKVQIETAIGALLECEKYQLFPQNICHIIKLPSMGTGYSDYRIMNDCETEDREHWQELKLKVDGKEILLGLNDIVIEMKPLQM